MPHPMLVHACGTACAHACRGPGKKLPAKSIPKISRPSPPNPTARGLSAAVRSSEHMRSIPAHTPLSTVLSQFKEAEEAWAHEKVRAGDGQQPQQQPTHAPHHHHHRHPHSTAPHGQRRCMGCRRRTCQARPPPQGRACVVPRVVAGRQRPAACVTFGRGRPVGPNGGERTAVVRCGLRRLGCVARP